MKKINFYSFYLLLLSTLFFVKCAKEYGDPPYVTDEQNITTLQIEVSKFNNAEGQLVIALFNSSDQFLNTTFRDTTVNINEEVTIVNLKDIPIGEYAISVFHDEDENGELTENLLFDVIPIPQEGYGFSNNPPVSTSAPSYQECKFEIFEGQILVVPIELNYF